MKKIDYLVNKMCPQGVEYKAIGELISKVTEKGKQVKNATQVYVVSNTQGMVKAEEYRENTIHSEDTSNYTVIRKDMFAYNPSRLNIGSIARLKQEEIGLVSPMYVVFSINEDIINKEYFEYNLKSSLVKNKINSLKEEGARFRFDFARWNLIKIPVPPKEIQNEIVKFLDNISNLSNKLIEERNLRHKQYDYYAKKLFLGSNCKEYLLGDIADFVYGYTDKAKDRGDTRFVRITDINEQGYLKETEAKYIESTEESKKSLLKKGDLVMARTGGTYGKTLYFESEEPCVYASFLIKITPNNDILLNKYYWHFTKTSLYWEQANKLVTSGGQPQFNTPALKKIKVPIPSINEQEKIIKILDKLDTFNNDSNKGLFAEIEARKKQYEYYRDKLLSFKELQK